MALDSACWAALRRNLGGQEKNILCLGYPDLLVDGQTLLKDCGGDVGLLVPNEQKIAQWHGWKSPVRDTTHALRKAFGLEATYVDIKPSRGCEIALDLNRSVWLLDMDHALWNTRWDVVADFGTIEHCFNIAQAFENIRMLAKPGGLVLHSNPLNRINHGFWSISPTTYFDYWEAASGTVLEARLVGGDVNRLDEMDIMGNHFRRFHCPIESNIQIVARTSLTEYTTRWPMQRKYKDA